MSRAERAPWIVPVLRSEVLASGSAAPLVSVPFLPWLRVYVAAVGPDGARLLEAHEATTAQRSFAEVVAEAVATMAGHPARIAQHPAHEGWFRVASDLGSASARLLDASVLRALESALEGEVVLAIPEPDVLLVARLPSVDDDALAQASIDALSLEAHERFTQSETPLSPMLYTCRAGVIRPLEAPPGSDLDSAQRHGLALLALLTYEEQRAQLEELAASDEASGSDAALRAGPLLVAEHPSMGAVTVTLWVEGHPALLPDADFVQLVPTVASALDDPDARELVALDALREVAPSSLVEHPDLRPMRLVPCAFPSAAERASLRAR